MQMWKIKENIIFGQFNKYRKHSSIHLLYCSFVLIYRLFSACIINYAARQEERKLLINCPFGLQSMPGIILHHLHMRSMNEEKKILWICLLRLWLILVTCGFLTAIARIIDQFITNFNQFGVFFCLLCQLVHDWLAWDFLFLQLCRQLLHIVCVRFA